MRFKMRKGFIAIIVFFFAIAVALVITPIIMQNISFHAISEPVKAFFIAESGVQYYIKNNLDGDSDWSDNSPAPLTRNFGEGSFSVQIIGPDPREEKKVILRSIGTITLGAASFSRTVEYTVEGSGGGGPFEYAAFGDADLTLSGQTETDSYNSEQGSYGQGGNIGMNGDAGTNGDISASGQAYIGGDASTGPEGNFNDQSRVAGTIAHDNDVTLSEITVPSALSSLPNEGDMSLSGQNSQDISGDHRYSSMSLSGQSQLTITGPANIYVDDGDISTSGQAEIVVSDSSTDPVIIYVDGDVSITGQGVVNDTETPSYFQLYGTGQDQDITLSGQGNLYGAVYAPNAELTISGQGELYGSFIGGEVTMSGQAVIHYDEALINLTLPGSSGGGAPTSYNLSEFRDRPLIQ